MEKGAKRNILKRPKFWAIVAVVVVAAFFLFRKKGGAVLNESILVKKGEVREELVLSGELKATESASLQFNSSGTVSWVGVKIGDIVKKGQPLLKLDTVVLNAAYSQALATLHASEANVNYVHDELKDKDSTETYSEINTRVAAESAHDKAYEAMVAARKALSDATIVSPFSGFVTALSNEVSGVNVTVGTPQVVVVNPTSLYFSVNADQTEVSKLHVGDKAEIIFDPFSDEKVNATVSQISFTPSNADSGTVYPMRLVLLIDNSNYKYKIGMTGDAHFILSKKDDALYVPSKFIKNDKNGKYVFIDNKSTKKYIEVGIEGEDREEIKGINEGTTIYN